MSMNSRRIRRSGVAGCVVAAAVAAFAVAPSASAQPAPKPAGTVKTELGGVFVDLTLTDALQRSRSEGRALVVEITPTNERKRNAQERWRQPQMEAWARRHAIVVAVGDMPTIRTLSEAGLTQATGGEPLLFIDGKWARLYGTNPGGASRLKTQARNSPTATGLLLKLHWTVSAAAKKDESWGQRHRTAVEAVTPSAKRVEWSSRSGAGVTAAGPVKIGAGGYVAAVRERLEEARRLAASDKPDDLAKASGLLVSLLELAMQETDVDAPSLWHAGMTAFAADAHALASRHEPLKKRFEEMFADALTRTDWTSERDIYVAMTLARVADTHVETLDFVDSALNDGDVSVMMPPRERVMWVRLLPSLHFNPPTLDDASVSRVRRMIERAAAAKTSTAPIVNGAPSKLWDAGVDVQRRVALFELCRMSAAMAAAGDAAGAKALRTAWIEQGMTAERPEAFLERFAVIDAAWKR